MRIKLETEGIIQLSNKLNKGLEKSAVTKGIQRVVLFMESEARRNITDVIYNRPVGWRRTGKARQSIVGKMVDDTSGKVFVGVNYAKHLEYGTKPHIIRAKRAKVLAGNGKVFGRVVNHPGTKAYPFWRPAIKATKTEAPKIMQKIITKELNKK